MEVKHVQRFTEEEAKAKVGKVVTTLTEFYRVPLGTTGQIVDTYKMAEGCFDVVVQWHLPNLPEPLFDRFAKSTYVQFLSEQI
jgi:hypothetical protein